MAVKTITFPRTAVRRIKYTTGELVATLDADGAVYCSAEQHHMAKWVFDLTAFQAERGLRQIIVSSVTVTWYTSAKYTYNIYFQAEPVLAKSQGYYVGSAAGTSTSSMVQIGCQSGNATLLAAVADAINGGSTTLYASCQNNSTSAKGHGTCQYGSLSIEYDYAAPDNVIDQCAGDGRTVIFGGSMGYSATINNTMSEAVKTVTFDLVRMDGETVVPVSAQTVDASGIVLGGTGSYQITTALYAWASAPRSTQIYLRATIAGDTQTDTETVAIGYALNRMINPRIDAFSVYRADNGGGTGWERADDGIYLLTELQISLNSDTADGFTLKVYYANGDIDTAFAQSIDLNLAANLATYKAGFPNEPNIVRNMDGGEDIGFAQNKGWKFLAVLTDGYETATAAGEIFTALTNMHLSGFPNGGVCYGGYCSADGRDGDANEDGAALAEYYYPIRAYGGIAEMDYSTTEMRTAAKWIDGKTIYRRVFVAENVGSSTQHIFADAIEGLETVAFMTGMFANANGQSQLPYVTTGAWTHIVVRPDGKVQFDSSDDFSIAKLIVVVDYTKGA